MGLRHLAVKPCTGTAIRQLTPTRFFTRILVTRLAAALQKAGQDKALVDQINATGCDTEILTPAQTVEKIKVDAAKWGKVVKDANMKAE